MNIGKTKVMVSGINCGDVERLGKWPCTVCVERVFGAIVSAVKGSLVRAEDTFVCKSR